MLAWLAGPNWAQRHRAMFHRAMFHRAMFHRSEAPPKQEAPAVRPATPKANRQAQKTF
jgi:hypothetical protein